MTFLSINARFSCIRKLRPSTDRVVKPLLIMVMAWGVFSAAWAYSPPLPAAEGSKPIAQSLQENRIKYQKQLLELADRAEQKGLTAEAQLTRTWLPPLDPYQRRVVVIPSERETIKPVTPETKKSLFPENNPSAHDPDWEKEFLFLRQEQAKRLFALAAQAAQQATASEAIGLLYDLLREDPNHSEARRILGYERFQDRWLTPVELTKTKSGQVWHDRFGWLPRDHVARYESGERFYRNQWIPEEQETKARSSLQRAWIVSTDHYQIRTNHSLEEGVRLSERLERLYQVWQQIFADFHLQSGSLKRAFSSSGTLKSSRKHLVVCFRDREQYIAELSKDQPRIDITSGYYMSDKRTAYFFAAEPADDTNLFHEATHQLFSETRPVVQQIALESNFWVIEGVACYMESLAEQERDDTVGGRNATRFNDAGFRLLKDDFYIPLEEFCSLGMQDLQADDRIGMIYSQASGWTYFLIHADEGRYRKNLLDYLLTVYTGRDSQTTLAEITGRSYADLDADYRRFFEAIAREPEKPAATEKKSSLEKP